MSLLLGNPYMPKPSPHEILTIAQRAFQICQQIVRVSANMLLPSVAETALLIFSHQTCIPLRVSLCAQGQWEKLNKGSWMRSMSPFDHKLLDIRIVASSSEAIEVSFHEEFFFYCVIFLVLGIAMMTLATFLSNSLVFYYSSAMAVGVHLVILMVLFQGMKLLPTGRKNSVAMFLYSSALSTSLLAKIVGDNPKRDWYW